jgi:multidrug efflux pump subunit AcrA (membrane-fusion protein)
VPDDLIGAPVDVIVAIDRRKDVLTVPVNALLAVAEGGFGLEVVDDDGTTEVVPVRTGLFGDGRVEVKGKGIAEGTVVGTAGR